MTNEVKTNPDAVRRWMKCKPRSTHAMIKRYGIRWRDLLPKSAHYGVHFTGTTYYWLPPRRASLSFEERLGALDLDCKGQV